MMKLKLQCIFLFLFCFVPQFICWEHPNIVLIITDDQDSLIGGMSPMKRTQTLLGKNGATFINSFVSTPICCPSRSSILTGMYTHNHKTENNTLLGGCSGHYWQTQVENKTFAAILHKEGNYKTFYAGKYLNEYGETKAGGPQHVPEGWTKWRGLVGNSKYYNFTISHDGVPHDYHNGEYLTDVIKEMALDFIDEESPSGNPFLLVLSPPAPHAPFEPALRHMNEFREIRALRTPNFNIPPHKDKHWLLQMQPAPLPTPIVDTMDEIYRARWRTLLAVDEMVEEVVKKLELKGVLDNTYIIFTSDNGYHIGQFSQPIDKRQPYETDIRVPLLIRGPAIYPGDVIAEPVINIDLAPTILKIAGIEPSEDMDGVPIPMFGDFSEDSLSKMISNNKITTRGQYDRQMLIEYYGESSNETFGCGMEEDHLYHCLPEFACRCQDAKNNTFSCVRHLHPAINFVYCAFKDIKETEESYDITQDPYQINNTINGLMPAIKFKYQNTLQHLVQCKGGSCNHYNESILDIE